nr:type II secretion system protein [Mesobacillus campisalis]
MVEVLAAIAILSIILVSVMNIFPQMGMMNKQNEEKAQAVNTAKLLLSEWKSDEKVLNALKKTNPLPQDWPDGYASFENGYYLFKLTEPKAEIKIWKEPPPTSKSKAHEVQIKLLSDRNNVLTETYGYIIVR